ncbi:hypothetical protein BGZ96_002078 [Linnemannia gamsii]|uniref:Uncharacterized protein n=1 Tax=Linnemannia gamsii TaxID=64522 RepID=A0ABQ7K8F4_9FUNG|nr:hypothetical protein BGZ96_002078 [Linnemannia gamsii]
MPVYRIGVVCTVALSGGGNTTQRKFLAILDDDVPMRDLPKHLTQQFNAMYRKKSLRFCLMEEIMDELERKLDLVGLVRERLRSNDIIRVKGRQLSREDVENAAFSWFFSQPAIAPLSHINHELTPAMSTTLAQALIPSLIPALIPALTPAFIQSVATLRRHSSSPPSPSSSRSRRLIASHPHKAHTLRDTESESETTTMNDDPNHVSEESSSSESDKDMDQDNYSESEDERPQTAVILEKEIKDQACSDEKSSDSDSSNEDNDDDQHKGPAATAPAAQIVRQEDAQINVEEHKKDAAEIIKDNDNALVDMFKDDAQMDSDSDSSSDEDEDRLSRITIPRVVTQAAVVEKIEPDAEEGMDTIIQTPIVPTHSAPSVILPKSPEPVKVKVATSPIKVIDTKPATVVGLDPLISGQSTTSSSSASSSPTSSRSSSPTPVRSPAPSPAPISRRESLSIFAAPAIIPAASPLSKEPFSDHSSPYRASSSAAFASSPVMSRVASSSSLALKRPSTDQPRGVVSPDRPKKKHSGFAIAVPQDHFRAFSPEIKQEYNSGEDSEEEGYFVSSQDFLYTALSRPLPSASRAPTPVVEDEDFVENQDMPAYQPLNLVVKQEEDDQIEEDQSEDEQAVRRKVVSVRMDDDDEEDSEKESAQFKSEDEDEDEAEEAAMSITSSSEPSSSQVSLIDIKEEPLSQNPSSLLAKYRESEEEEKTNTTAAPVFSRISTTRVPSAYDEEEEEEDERLSPVVSPPGALLEYLNKPPAPPAVNNEQLGLSTTPKHPLSAPASPAPAPVPVPTPTVKVSSPSKALSNTMSAYPTFASLASIRGPDVHDPTSNTDEIVAFLDKDMEGLSRDSSLTGAPYFLSSRPSVTAPKATTPPPAAPVSPVLGLGDESTVSPELRPSVSPMVVPKIEDHHKVMEELDLNHHNSNHYSQLLSDSEDSVFNIPSAQQPVPLGEQAPTTPKKAFAATNGWVDDTRDAMDDYHSSSSSSDSDDDENTSTRRYLSMAESEYEEKPTDISEGMFGPNKITNKRKPQYRYETVFRDISLTPFSSQDRVPKRPRNSSPFPAASSSGSDSSSAAESSDDEDHQPNGKSTDPHPLDALGELPMMISSQSSLPSMPTLTSLSQERNTKTKKMGSLEMALKQTHGGDEDDDDDFVITIKRTGPTALVRSPRGRGGAASSPGRRGGRGGVTIAAAGGRAGSVSNRGRASGGGLEDLFA